MKLLNAISSIFNTIWSNISLIMFIFSALGLVCSITYACYVADVLQYVLVMLAILAFIILHLQIK